MNSTASLLRFHRLKHTPFRLALLNFLQDATEPLSVGEIETQLNQLQTETIDKVTLYRNLELFEKLGVVCRLYFTGQQALYELRGDDLTHHHHLICTNCQKIEDITECVIKLPAVKSGFKVDHHHLEFYGLCENCQLKKVVSAKS